jgi:hypothetical protein
LFRSSSSESSSERCCTATAAFASTRFQYARCALAARLVPSSSSPMSAISRFFRAVVTCARSGSILKLRSNGCDTIASSCAVTDGLKFDSELLALERSELQPKL